MTDWKYERIPEEGAMRVWCIVNIPSDVTRYAEVHTIEEATSTINAEADRQLKDPNVESNVFGLEVYKSGKWEEWEDDNGYDIEHYCDED